MICKCVYNIHKVNQPCMHSVTLLIFGRLATLLVLSATLLIAVATI